MIYFAKREGDGAVRVGTTGNLKQRMAALASSGKSNLTVLASIDGSFREEAFLHHCFEPVRIEGEWFEDCSALRSVVDEACRVGRLVWVPPFDGAAHRWAENEAIRLFGSLDDAVIALGYSEKTAVSDIFGWSADRRGIAVRLRFHFAFIMGRLPAEVKALHGDTPLFKRWRLPKQGAAA